MNKVYIILLVDVGLFIISVTSLKRVKKLGTIMDKKWKMLFSFFVALHMFAYVEIFLKINNYSGSLLLRGGQLLLGVIMSGLILKIILSKGFKINDVLIYLFLIILGGSVIFIRYV